MEQIIDENKKHTEIELVVLSLFDFLLNQTLLIFQSLLPQLIFWQEE